MTLKKTSWQPGRASGLPELDPPAWKYHRTVGDPVSLNVQQEVHKAVMGEGLPPESWTRKKKPGHKTDHLLPLFLCMWGAGSSCTVLPQTLST